MTTPNGTLELCYDEINRAYRVPLFCILNPTNLITQSTSIINENDNKNGNVNVNENENSLSTVIVESHPINLKIRINPGDFNLNIAASTANSVKELKHFILEQSAQQVLKKSYKIILYVIVFCLIIKKYYQIKNNSRFF